MLRITFRNNWKHSTVASILLLKGESGTRWSSWSKRESWDRTHGYKGKTGLLLDFFFFYKERKKEIYTFFQQRNSIKDIYIVTKNLFKINAVLFLQRILKKNHDFYKNMKRRSCFQN